MIRRLLLILLFSFMISFGIVLSAFASEADNKAKTIIDTNNICMKYNTVCLFKVIPSNNLNAYTNGTTIFIFTRLINHLDEDELRSILFHELSHILLDHNNRIISVHTSREVMSKFEYRLFRQGCEMEADMLATHLLLSNGYPSKLDEALVKITPKGKLNYSSITHPSTISRVKNIRKIEVIYGR